MGNSEEFGERLAQSLADGVEGLDQLGLAKLDNLMAHPEMARDRAGMGRLVKGGAADPHGERGQIGRGLRGESGDEARIEPARQEHADRDIGDDLLLHRPAQQFVEPLDRLVPFNLADLDTRLPIALAADPAVFQGQDRAGFELLDPGPSGYASGQILEQQEAVGGVGIGSSVAKRRMAEECGDLGGKDQPAPRDPPIERLFAEAVAHQVNRTVGAVAIGKGEHAADAFDGAAHAQAADQLEQDFRIRPVAQGDPVAAELVGERPVAIDLAVEDKRVAASRVDPRLRPAIEVDDRQPRMAEGDPFVDKNAIAVGPAMGECGVHPGEHRPGIGPGSGEPGYAAHRATTGGMPRAAAARCDAAPPGGSCRAGARAPRNRSASGPRR